jgi:hypothetical protein
MYSCNLFVVAVGYTPGYVWGLSTEGVFVVEEEGMRYRELSRVSGLHENVPTALYTTAQGLDGAVWASTGGFAELGRLSGESVLHSTADMGLCGVGR